MSNFRLAGLGMLLAITSFIFGCSQDTKPNDPPQQPPVQRPEKNLQLRTILSKNAPSDKKQSPIQSAIAQNEWELSDSTKHSPTEQNVNWETTFLQNSVVALQVPVTDPWFNIVFLTHQDEEWSMVGLADLHVRLEDTFSDNEGLNLPMNRFVFSKLTLGAEDNQAWIFADDAKQVVIGKSPHTTAFSVLENAKAVQVNDIEVWYVKQATGSLLYYIDQGHVVWVAGNLSESELLTLAKSLPSATVYTFPFANPKNS